MKLLIDRETLKRKIMEDDYDGDVEAGDPRLLEALVRSVQRDTAQRPDDDAAKASGS
ncbi:hypothetical protein D3C71_189320 [compost metagenome]